MASILEKQSTSKHSYVWIDVELTGLNLNKDTILEIACIITKPDLVPVHEEINLVFNHSDEVLNSMSPWCITQHEKSGLTKESRNSKISVSEGDAVLADYIRQHTNPKGVRYAAGNSVYLDRIFIKKHMPLVDSLLHYRVIDVSSIKTLCEDWYPSEYRNLCKKKLAHRALDDIKESLQELKSYRENIFKQIHSS